MRGKPKFEIDQVVSIRDEDRGQYRYRRVAKVWWDDGDPNNPNKFDGWWYRLDGNSADHAELILLALTERERGPERKS